jgi:GDP-L-fucose synthase
MNKILVTGGNGLLGSALKKDLGDSHKYLSSKDVNLLNNEETDIFLSNKSDEFDTIIHCAAKVGGVQANMNDNLGFFEDNYLINKNIIETAYKYKYKNFVSILSTCIFPDKIEYPLTSNKIDEGEPHSSNYGYAYAKRTLGYLTKTFGAVLKANWISVVPTNIYGPNDNFHLENSHLIPALIRKGYEASLSGEDFEIWGDGTPLRQFIFSEDLSKVIIWAIDNWKSNKPFMAINEQEYSIKEIVEIISKRFNIPPEKIKYNTSKPSGQFRKPAKTDILEDFKFTPLEEGINKTIDWFIENYDTARK